MKKSIDILSQLQPEIKPAGRSRQSGEERSQHEPKQLSLFPEPETPRKPARPQIASSPGVSAKQRNRYRVSLGAIVLGDRLTLDEAVKLAKRGEG